MPIGENANGQTGKFNGSIAIVFRSLAILGIAAMVTTLFYIRGDLSKVVVATVEIQKRLDRIDARVLWLEQRERRRMQQEGGL